MSKKVNRILSYYKLRLARLPASNYAISSGFACGSMVSFTPLLGLHFLLAVIFAVIFSGSYKDSLGKIILFGNELRITFILRDILAITMLPLKIILRSLLVLKLK